MADKATIVAAIYDVHGNLPALEAVLSDLEMVEPDLVVVGGDVASGPMPVEVLERLEGLGERVRWVRGNADREVVSAYDGGRTAIEGHTPEPALSMDLWTVERISEGQRNLLASFQEHIVVEVEGLGEVLFCHATPGSDEEIVTTATSDERLQRVLAGADQDLILCGHVHTQFDRRVGDKRLVNAGSVGLPYQGEPVGAFWVLLGPDGAEMRRSDYDLRETVERCDAIGYPAIDSLKESLLTPPNPALVAEFFESQVNGGS